MSSSGCRWVGRRVVRDVRAQRRGHPDPAQRLAQRPPDTGPGNGDNADNNNEHEDNADADEDTPASADSEPTDDAEPAANPGDAASHAHADGEDEDAEDEGEGDGLGWRDHWRQRREATNVRALMALCKQRLGMTGGSAPAAGKPTMLILADLAAPAGDGDGVGSATAQLLLESTRGPVELTHTAAERLACEANWRIVLPTAPRSSARPRHIRMCRCRCALRWSRVMAAVGGRVAANPLPCASTITSSARPTAA